MVCPCLLHLFACIAKAQNSCWRGQGRARTYLDVSGCEPPFVDVLEPDNLHVKHYVQGEENNAHLRVLKLFRLWIPQGETHSKNWLRYYEESYGVDVEEPRRGVTGKRCHVLN